MIGQYDPNLPDNLKRDSSFNNEYEVICPDCDGDGYSMIPEIAVSGEINPIQVQCSECSGTGTIIKSK